MYAFGRSRAERMMSKNEEGGRSNSNPYAQAIFRRFVLPLSAVIAEDCSVRKAGRRKAHAALLEPLDPEAIAYLAVRNVLNTIMGGDRRDNGPLSATARSVCTAVGRACYHELLLGLFEHASPDLFYTLVNDLGRRLSKSERHRMTVFKMQAKSNGIEFPEWGPGGVQQVGAYLVDVLEGLGMVETWQDKGASNGRKASVRVSVNIKLTAEMLALVDQIRGHVIETTPYFLPCIEPPKPWVAVNDGGFHTQEMRRMQPFAVKAHNREAFYEGDMTRVLAAINHLQNVAWRINSKMLDTIRLVAKHYDMEEVLSQAEYPAPDKPHWLMGDMTKELMSPEQEEEFKQWKRAKREWFSAMKVRGTKYGRFYTATTVADKFREFPRIHFVYFADFRGRLYAQTTGVSPQGSDLQKSLLCFAAGKPLDTLEAERWFQINGANKWGYDKASLDDRVKFIRDRQQIILSFADDPIANSGWREADCPLQFLAWAFEYAEWVREPHTFVSYLPVGMDGSCNGLQNFSAMLRDAVGGRATNLVPGPLPSDIYQMTAEVTEHKLRQDDPDEANYRQRWLDHGINRTLVKRSVMTLPYGSTRFSCADFIVEDYLKTGKCPAFERNEYARAAQYLSHYVWDSIGEVVVKAREAMNWLQASTRKILVTHDDIRWVTPSGFPVVQSYKLQESHRIRTNLCGNAFLRLNVELPEADGNRHRNGVAPNFIHSYDAAHLTLVTNAAAIEGLDLAMIHDDYGTHAADAAALYRIIRETFVAMYEERDPLVDFQRAYNLPEPPARGTLDLRQVLNSPYFFS